MSDFVPPPDAATVILVRSAIGPEAEPEVFLMRRHPKSVFYGGAFVFPGGRVDGDDGDESALAVLPEGGAEACAAVLDPTPGVLLTTARAAAVFVAAARELFEEAGVLLVRHPDGRRWEGGDDDALTSAQRRLNAGELGFSSLLAALDVCIDLDGLAYWAHWVTPSFEPKRFDARFFVARMPVGQEAVIDGSEAVQHTWLSPSAAIAAHTRGEVELPPPTFRNLEQLGELIRPGMTADELLLAVRGRAVHAIMPKLGQTPDGPAILLPWDPLYAQATGEGLLHEPDYPDSWRSGVSRLVLRDGRWVSGRG